MADEVITAFGRIGEWFAISREDVAPDLISVAKGLTSAYAPMGAVLVRKHVLAPLVDGSRVFRHGITFGGHPLSAAIALRNIEIIERDQVLENVRALAGPLHDKLQRLLDLPIVGDVRGAGFFWAMGSSGTPTARGSRRPSVTPAAVVPAAAVARGRHHRPLRRPRRRGAADRSAADRRRGAARRHRRRTRGRPARCGQAHERGVTPLLWGQRARVPATPTVV
ncbi:aminotransferase class III-fold pyridoxal phosphate-dependent enzyme [Aeromicrobium sp. UC242_57]|uniref:aminotransferase class III-fold pyridoxal phosphate-dependent enzyme n=1 Tax=Aeromicrobium sp. UC242_57 TaxID=3374624 RepID=UPI0037A56517